MDKTFAMLIGWVWLGTLAACRPGEGTDLPPVSPSPPTLSPTSTVVPTPTPTITPTPAPTPTKEVSAVTFTVVYDNNPYDPALQTAWGFACWVETPQGVVLFDTGGDGPTLLGNLARLGLDPRAVDVVVLSHAHGDHTGGLRGLLDAGAHPIVYVPSAFPDAFKEAVRARTDLVEVVGPMEVLPGIHTTGPVGSSIVEQALVVETDEGIVVVTGCAHPGVVEMVRCAKEVAGEGVALLMGGFHLSRASRSRIEAIIGDLRSLGVQRVAPCHCTGDLARRMFAEAFGNDFFPAGVGWRIALEGAGGGH